MRNAALFIAVLASACAPSEDEFAEVFSSRLCVAHKSCDEDRFWDDYDDGTPTCQKQWTLEVERKRYGGGRDVACAWNEAKATECLASFDGATCDDVWTTWWWDYCVRVVWDCLTVVGG